MVNWDHEGHDRRRGDKVRMQTRDCTFWVCLDCKLTGLTLQDISDWPQFNESDYYRNVSWIDPEVAAWYEERNDGS